MLFEEFPLFCDRAVRAWNLVHYFPLTLYLAVIVLGVWEYGNFFFGEVSVFVGAILSSTVVTCSATVLWWLLTDFTHFLRCARFESQSVALPSVAKRRSVPSRCFWLQFCCAQFARGKLEVLFELHVAEMRDDGQHFLEHPGVPAQPGSQSPGCLARCQLDRDALST